MSAASSPSRLGPGGVSGLASSLRSASATTSPANSGSSYGSHADNSSTNRDHRFANGSRNQYQNNGDATVPDSDDSTEEDEEYSSYLQEQEQQQKKKSQAMLLRRQLLHDDLDQDMRDSDQAEDEEEEGYFHQQQQQRRHQDQFMDGDVDMEGSKNGNTLEDEEDFEDDEEDLDEDSSETNSLTEDDIDFNLVYAFHTFAATQEGQASVVRNDSLMLLEDTNVYWWLVRVLKTGVIGYIPAENIETPFERLARLNKYRNVGLSAPTAEWGTFDEDITPRDPAAAAERALNRRSVIFTGQNEYFGASDNEWDDEEEEEGDDEMGEYYAGGEEGDQAQVEDENEVQDRVNGVVNSDAQAEAERAQQDMLNDQKQLKALSQLDEYESDSQDEAEDMEEEPVTNRHCRPLLDDDDLFNAEPRIISLTPSIARDDMGLDRSHQSTGKPRKLRLADEEPLSLRSGGSSSRANETNQFGDDDRSPSFDSEEEERQKVQRRMQERTEAKLNAILGNNQQAPVRKTKEEYEAGLPPEAPKKPGKFKSLFGVGKSSKDKDKERRDKERTDKERTTKATGADDEQARMRSNSSGSIGSIGADTPGTPRSPTNASENGDSLQQEIITLRVYPGNVDFGASMYKTVVVSPTTQAHEVANQAVVKFRLAPDGVASTSEFYLTVRGVDGDETVLLPNDKPMAIYQSLTAHLTTPLPANHRLSISSVSSMMSINSTSSFNSNPSSTPASPGSVRRIGSGRTDPHQRSIRFLLNKKIRRAGSISTSIPSTPTTPTTPTNPQDDFFWVKVVCLAKDLPQTMILLDGMGTALEKADPRTQGQITSAKVEHWIPMHATSNAGDVIFKAIEKIGIRAGVVDGVPESILAAKRSSLQNGVVIEYQLGLRIKNPAARKAKQSDELSLPPQVPLHRCFEDHQLVPVRRSPKADVASMPPSPDYVFYLRKAAKSQQAEMAYQDQQAAKEAQSPKKVPAPLSLRSNASINDSPRSPAHPSPTGMVSPRSLRSLKSHDDANVSNTEINGLSSGASSPGGGFGPGQKPGPNSNSRNMGGAGSPQLNDGQVRIPRRTDSVILSPASPVRANSHDMSGRPSPTLSNGAHPPSGNRTPTPDQHLVQGRTRSPSVSQGSTGQDGSRSSTPDRPTRPERPERQRAVSPSMTHGPSPLSLSAVMIESEKQSRAQQALRVEQDASLFKDRPISISSNSSESSRIAPLSIKKNATQGVDIVLNKGVIRSSRLMSSKQYRYSFIPLAGGEEVDISDIIEDILGEENDGDDDEDDEGLQVLQVEQDSRSRAAALERDRLQQLGNSARGGDTLLKLERVLARDHDGPSRTPARATDQKSKPSSLTVAQTLSHKKSDSDVEIQVASLTSLTARSASPMMEPPTRAFVSDSAPGSPRSMRSASPFGVMAKPTLLANPASVSSAGASQKPLAMSSPLRESPVGAAGPAPGSHQDLTSNSRSFSPIPRRLQSPSPAIKPSPGGSSPTASHLATMSGRDSSESMRSNSGSSITTPRSRSASTSVVTKSGLQTGSKDQWMLSSDYNAGMQDLLTLVRAGRSSSVSSGSLSMRGGGPIVGKDGKIVALPSTLKASLMSSSSSRSNSPRGSNSVSHSPFPDSSLSQGRYDTTFDDQINDKNYTAAGDEEARENRARFERARMVMLNELTLKDVQDECHPEVYDCWKDVDADLDRVERELDELLVTVKASML